MSETWVKRGAQGQHDEEGWIIEIGGGLRLRTPSLYDVAHAMGKSHHDTEVWQRYNALPNEMVAMQADLKQARDRSEELKLALDKAREVLAVRAHDGTDMNAVALYNKRLADEAGARIEALEHDRDGYKQALDDAHRSYKATIEALEQENERLAAALDMTLSNAVSVSRKEEVARAALADYRAHQGKEEKG